MSTRKLKRNISNDPNNDYGSHFALKKPKIRKPLLQHTDAYETPHPTALSQSEVYKLPSSVGERMSPSKFSPIPKAVQVQAKTSSTNLKENASTASPFNKDRYPMNKKYGSKKQKKQKANPNLALESPFYPSSPAAVSLRKETTQAGLEKLLTFTQGSESPPAVLKPKSTARRPSAPTPPRKSDWKEIKVGIPTNGSAVDLLHDDNNVVKSKSTAITAATEDVFHRAPNFASINFNRPPSQLSLYDYNRSITYSPERGGDEFFSNIRGESTPFNNDKRPPLSANTRSLRSSHVNPVSDTDTDSDSCEGGGAFHDSDSDFDMGTERNDSLFPSLKLASRARARSNGSGYVTPSEDDEEDHDGSLPRLGVPRSPWINDSLISAPDTRDWRLPPRSAPRYMRGEKELKDAEMEQSFMEGMFESLIIDDGTSKQSSASVQKYSLPPLDCDAVPPPSMILRTRSLGDADELRDLPQSQSQSQLDPNHEVSTTYAKRTRSGTVVQAQKPDAVATGAPVLAPALPVISSVFRRTRSGTVTVGSGKPGLGVISGSFISSNPATSSAAASSATTRRTRSGTVVVSASATNSTNSNEGLPPPAPAPVTGRKRSGSVMQLPMLESVGEAHAVVSRSSGEVPPPPIRSRTASGRTRSGSTTVRALVPILASVGEREGASVSVGEGGGDMPAPRSSRRLRSGSVQGVGAGIKAALGKLPIPGSGMLGRMSGNGAGKAALSVPSATAPALAPVSPYLDHNAEMVVAEGSRSPDPLEVLMWSPVIRKRAPPENRKGPTSVNANAWLNVMAMDIDEGLEADDPLLLKPGDEFD
ncbi:hypothetical protein E1B28_007206 [Marasmius oreades]|uniref:Uncharacterized protein n=1 Tax=Marasmius oreades TaxID=181124 RepID=A0A9P7S149_9AGAR|nr:uncharacterized protein E1B28_007206 [Marasmius oreades]KAG7093534.1 hypothetical protein E1B28_007206 [Marasmius oreades]